MDKEGGKDGSTLTGKEWRKWHEERKSQRRKWKEDKVMAGLDKLKAAEDEEQDAKRQRLEGEERRQRVGRDYTVSIAVPGSILDNAQTPELRTYLAGQIARGAVVFNVDEIIIFDESDSKSKTTEGEFEGVGKKGNCNVQLARILQYLECPQYLRKAFFPQHRDLQYAGLLNPLDTPHHMRTSSRCPYREGVVLDVPVKEKQGSYVDVGLHKHIQIDRVLTSHLRVTVKVDYDKEAKKKIKGQVVSPCTPRTEEGLYWGYQVRLAANLSEVFTGGPHKGGYDLTVGTSEKGATVDEFTVNDKFKHLLVVFGGVEGLESCLEADPHLNMDDPSLLFNHYLNTCPAQGSGTIRTEEAILITMAALRPKICEVHQKEPL